jgi:hypothetical protein
LGGGGGLGGEMNQALYAHMNNKRKRKKKRHALRNPKKKMDRVPKCKQNYKTSR